MIEPEQEAFRRALRARTRPPAPEVDDDEWTPHQRWDSPAEPVGQMRHGPPPSPNPTPGALAARRYRERRKAMALAAQEWVTRRA